MSSILPKTLILVLSLNIFPNFLLASARQKRSSSEISGLDEIRLNPKKKRKIEYLILHDRFKTIVPKLAVGMGIFSVAVAYDFYQKVYGIMEGDHECTAEEIHSLSNSAISIVETALGNQFFLGSLCASFGTDGIRATFDGAEYLLGKIIGTRNLDSRSEIERGLLEISMEMEEKIDNNRIPKTYCKHLESTLRKGIFPIQSYDNLNHENLLTLKRYWQALKDLPYEPIFLDYEQASTDLEPIIENFDHQFQQSFKVFIKKLSVDPAKIKEVENTFEMSIDTKHILYLLGDAAVGKTTFAHNLARALKLPISKIKMGDCKRGNFVGSTNYSDSKSLCTSFNTMSELTNALTNMNGKNGILFLDEIDKTLNNVGDYEVSELKTILLELLDPDRKTIYLRDIGVDVDISGLIIILSGNKQLNNKYLRDRMHTLLFKGFSKEVKLQLARKLIPALFSLYGVNRASITANEEYSLDLDEEVYDLVSKMINLDPSKGVRAFKLVLKDFCPWVSIKDEKAKISEFDLKETYKSYNVELKSESEDEDAADQEVSSAANNTTTAHTEAYDDDSEGAGVYRVIGQAISAGILEGLKSGIIKVELTNLQDQDGKAILKLSQSQEQL